MKTKDHRARGGPAKVLVLQDLLMNLKFPSKKSQSKMGRNRTISEENGIPSYDPNSELVDNLSQIFFDLANAKYVGYRPKLSLPIPLVTVSQDNACLHHTGGIVWETSYLLASFLESKYSKESSTIKSGDSKINFPLARTLEIGSGCGLLGLVLATIPLSSTVILTETSGPLKKLSQNVREYNAKVGSSNSKQTHESNGCQRLRATKLCWNNFEKDILREKEDLLPHSFDTIVGTDVVFSIDLVIPMLKTLVRMSHSKTKIYLCLQERCKDAHAKLMEEAPRFFKVKDYTERASRMEGCEWGSYMDCKLFRLKKITREGRRRKRNRVQDEDDNNANGHENKKSKKKKKEHKK